MTTDSSNTKYKYNIAYEEKEAWFGADFWKIRQSANTRFKTHEYKDGDVIVTTFPRSGTHMTWVLTQYLLRGSTEPLKDAMEDSHLPPMTPENKQVGRRVLSTHFLPVDFGDDFFRSGKYKFILVSRNPKDSMVSIFHLSKQFGTQTLVAPDNWQEWVQFCLTSDVSWVNWFNHARAWEEFMDKNPGAPILSLKFEEIVRDPETNIKKMAKFLDVPLSDKLLQDIVVAGKFENMKNIQVSDQIEFLRGSTFYRKGKVGDWVNTFTVAQNELFDSVYEEKMKGSKVTVIYR